MNGTCAAIVLVSALSWGADPESDGRIRADSVLITLIDRRSARSFSYDFQ